MEYETGIDGLSCRIDKNDLILEFKEELKVLSNAVLNGGMRRAKYIVNHHVVKDFKNPEKYMYSSIKKLGLNPYSTVGFMTAVNMNNAEIITKKNARMPLFLIVTAGLSNATSAGDPAVAGNCSTINIIIVIDANLNDRTFVDLIRTVTEAKSKSLWYLDVRSGMTGEIATGTNTDGVAIAATQRGEEIPYGGTGTFVGELISKAVISGVIRSVKKSEGIVQGRSMLMRLKERGITVNDVIEAAMKLYVGPPNLKDKYKEYFLDAINEALKDVNVSALIEAAIRLEDDGRIGLIPGLRPNEFKEDPVYLLADELIGIEISQYIAGSRGLFEYIRFDREKPGIIGKLGPFLDDVIAALIGGASSLAYTKMHKRSH